MARKSPKRLTKSSLVKAIEGSLGNLSEVARRLGVSRNTVYTSIERFKLQGELKSAREVQIDSAEAVLNHILLKGKDEKNRLRASMYVLSNMGKDRGWTERRELQHSGQITNYTVDIGGPPEGD